jgi:hypothetical protein
MGAVFPKMRFITIRRNYPRNAFRGPAALMVTALLLALVSGPAPAETWKMVGSTDHGRFFIDLDSMHVVNGLVDYREQLRFNTPQVAKSGGYTVEVSRHYVNCARKTAAVHQDILYAANGDVVAIYHWDESDITFRQYPRRSPGATEIELVCSRMHGNRNK